MPYRLAASIKEAVRKHPGFASNCVQTDSTHPTQPIHPINQIHYSTKLGQSQSLGGIPALGTKLFSRDTGDACINKRSISIPFLFEDTPPASIAGARASNEIARCLIFILDSRRIRGIPPQPIGLVNQIVHHPSIANRISHLTWPRVSALRVYSRDMLHGTITEGGRPMEMIHDYCSQTQRNQWCHRAA